MELNVQLESWSLANQQFITRISLFSKLQLFQRAFPLCCALQDGCTCLHAAVRSGQVDTLCVLLRHRPQGEPTVTPDLQALPATLLNQANQDGWTAAHMAAALGLKVRTVTSLLKTTESTFGPSLL